MPKRAGPIQLTPAEILELRRVEQDNQPRSDAIGESCGIREIRSPLTDRMLRPLTGCNVVQTCRSLTDNEYLAIAALLDTAPDVLFRVYGQILERPVGNVEFLRHFPQVRRFCIDSWSIDSLDGLQYLPQDLIELDLGESAMKKPLRWVAERFPRLQSLSVSSKIDDVTAIGSFRQLNELFVLGCTFRSLDCLQPLTKLVRLTIMGGTTRNLTALPQVGRLKHLKLCRNSALLDGDVEPLTRLAELQYLELDWLSKVQRLPDFRSSPRLRRVDIRTLNRLVDVSGLRSALQLRTLCLEAKAMRAPALASLVGHPTLKDGFLRFGTAKESAAAAQVLRLIQPDYGSDFQIE